MTTHADLSSIAPLLPLRSRREGLLQWTGAAEYALKALARGPATSQVINVAAFCDWIEDARTENGIPTPLSPNVAGGLAHLCDELPDPQSSFFGSTLPIIANLALQLPALLENHEIEIGKLPGATSAATRLRVLFPQRPGLVLLHQRLIAALLACAFLCLYPEGEDSRRLGVVNINFTQLYSGVERRICNVQKLLCLVHYFSKVGSHMPQGTVSFERKVVPAQNSASANLSVVVDGSIWDNSLASLCAFKIINDGSIQDAGSEYLQIDFANKRLGGGALRAGCVQEEIRFMVCPECIAGMLFLPDMEENESIEIIGAEKYCQYTGYGDTFRFARDFTDDTPRDSWGRRQTCIGAIDALCRPGKRQFSEELMIRELTKAYCGFSNHSTLCGLGGDLIQHATSDAADWGSFCAIPDGEEPLVSVHIGKTCNAKLDAETVDSNSYNSNAGMGSEKMPCGGQSASPCLLHPNLSGVATGNWGAGAFGGNLQLKSFLQWLSASQAGCPVMIYYTFGDTRADRLQEVVLWIQQQGWCVSELWSIIQRYGKCRVNHEVNLEICDWILPREN